MALGFVRLSVSSSSLWMTPIFVVFELIGPSSLTLLPKRSVSSVVPPSGMLPSMEYGPSAAKALGATSAQAVAYIVMLRFVIVVPITLTGLVLLVTRYGGLGKLRTARA